MKEKELLKLGIPDGSLQAKTLEIMEKAGWKIKVGGRSYYPSIDDDEIMCMIARPQEMAHYVGRGVLDAGITGYDWMVEVNHPDVVDVAELKYSKATSRPVKWVIAVPDSSPIRTVKDLEGKIISTEVVGITKRFLESHGVKATVEFSWGATEVKPPHLADAIVDLTETGTSLMVNKLRVIETILESTTRLVANKKALADRWKSAKIGSLSTMIKAVLDCRNLVGIMLNVEENNKDKVLSVLPSMKSPTVSQLSGQGKWYAVNTVIDETLVRKLLPRLKEAGAEDIVEYPLNKVVK